jgi:hypothetical protein
MELMQGIAQGHSNKLIARNLGISPRTAEVHRARLMERLQAKSLAEVVRLAVWAQANMPSAFAGPPGSCSIRNSEASMSNRSNDGRALAWDV